MLIHGNNLEELPKLADASIDAIITDPPYELGFMGKSWDSTGIAYNTQLWRECLRVLKPGGHLLAFSGSRTYHRMAVAIEDAGFEIRDQIMWVYGSGFPKSLDVSKAIDKQAGAEREVVGFGTSGKSRHVLNAANTPDTFGGEYEITAPSSDQAKQWEGWGTALKPAHEPIVLARKPLNGTVANNVLQHGTGALNIDDCRVEYASENDKTKALADDAFKRKDTSDRGWSRPWMENQERIEQINREAKARAQAGRWPANLIHDGSDEVLQLFPDTTGDSAARFFYCAKANKRDRNEGLEHMPVRRASAMGYDIGLGEAGEGMFKDRNPQKQNHHPTVKPTELMRYLCRLITPPGGTILDPFTGSGSTGKAAILEGFNFIGIELDPDYIKIAEARIDYAYTQRH